MSDKSETASQPVTAAELDRLFKNAEIDFASNWKPCGEDNDRYAQLIDSRQIKSDARSASPKPGTKAKFAQRLQRNIATLTQKSFRVKLDAVLDHGKEVFKKALSDDQREINQQHDFLEEREKLLTKQQAKLIWFLEWGQLGMFGELVGRSSGAAPDEGRISGIARFEAVSEKLQSHVQHLLHKFESYRTMREKQANSAKQEVG